MEASNVKEMRKAPERQAHFLQRLHAQEGENGVVSKVRLEEEIKAVTAALSAPPRQCDVGTAKEQKQRYDEWRNHDELRAVFGLDKLDWAQMPYEEGGAK